VAFDNQSAITLRFVQGGTLEATPHWRREQYEFIVLWQERA
jgi:hypothetical protein